MQYVITCVQGFSPDIGDKLQGLGVKIVNYKPNIWNIETKLSKKDLTKSLSNPRLGEVKIVAKV